jgi:phenylalanine-4-hydroxylase
VYWYTIEFGLVEQADGVRIYGSGIASSYSESVYALDDPRPKRIRFELERVMRTRYRIDDLQDSYFVLGGLDELLELAKIDFAPLYRKVKPLPDIAPGETLSGDRLL